MQLQVGGAPFRVVSNVITQLQKPSSVLCYSGAMPHVKSMVSDIFSVLFRFERATISAVGFSLPCFVRET